MTDNITTYIFPYTSRNDYINIPVEYIYVYYNNIYTINRKNIKNACTPETFKEEKYTDCIYTSIVHCLDDGRLTGECILFSGYGTVKTIYNFVNGLIHGKKYQYILGSIYEEEDYNNGYLVGYIRYTPNGTIKESSAEISSDCGLSRLDI